MKKLVQIWKRISLMSILTLIIIASGIVLPSVYAAIPGNNVMMADGGGTAATLTVNFTSRKVEKGKTTTFKATSNKSGTFSWRRVEGNSAIISSGSTSAQVTIKGVSAGVSKFEVSKGGLTKTVTVTVTDKSIVSGSGTPAPDGNDPQNPGGNQPQKPKTPTLSTNSLIVPLGQNRIVSIENPIDSESYMWTIVNENGAKGKISISKKYGTSIAVNGLVEGNARVSVYRDSTYMGAIAVEVTTEGAGAITEVTSVEFPVTTISMQKNSSTQIRRNVYPTSAQNKDLTWSSSDNSIATVSSTGNVTSKNKDGIVTITAKTRSGYSQATCIVRVGNASFTPSLSQSSIPDLPVGHEVAINVLGADGVLVTNVYSSNSNIVEVKWTQGTKTFTASALKSGKATIYVELANGSRLSCLVTVPGQEDMQNPELGSTFYGMVGSTIEIPDNGDKLSTSNKNIKISKHKVSLKSIGEATITGKDKSGNDITYTIIVYGPTSKKLTCGTGDSLGFDDLFESPRAIPESEKSKITLNNKSQNQLDINGFTVTVRTEKPKGGDPIPKGNKTLQTLVGVSYNGKKIGKDIRIDIFRNNTLSFTKKAYGPFEKTDYTDSYVMGFSSTVGNGGKLVWEVSGGENSYSFNVEEKDKVTMTVKGTTSEVVTITAKIVVGDEVKASASCQATIVYYQSSLSGYVGDVITIQQLLNVEETKGFKFVRNKEVSKDYLDVTSNSITLKKKAVNQGASVYLDTPNGKKLIRITILEATGEKDVISFNKNSNGKIVIVAEPGSSLNYNIPREERIGENSRIEWSVVKGGNYGISDGYLVGRVEGKTQEITVSAKIYTKVNKKEVVSADDRCTIKVIPLRMNIQGSVEGRIKLSDVVVDKTTGFKFIGKKTDYVLVSSNEVYLIANTLDNYETVQLEVPEYGNVDIKIKIIGEKEADVRDTFTFDKDSYVFTSSSPNYYFTLSHNKTLSSLSRVDWAVSGGSNTYTVDEDGTVHVSGRKSETVTVSVKVYKEKSRGEEVVAKASCKLTVVYVRSAISGYVSDVVDLKDHIDGNGKFKFISDSSNPYIKVINNGKSIKLISKPEGGSTTVKLQTSGPIIELPVIIHEPGENDNVKDDFKFIKPANAIYAPLATSINEQILHTKTLGDNSRIEWKVTPKNYSIDNNGVLTGSAKNSEVITISAKIIKNESGRDFVMAEDSVTTSINVYKSSFDVKPGDVIKLTSVVQTRGYRFESNDSCTGYLKVSSDKIEVEKNVDSNTITVDVVTDGGRHLPITIAIAGVKQSIEFENYRYALDVSNGGATTTLSVKTKIAKGSQLKLKVPSGVLNTYTLEGNNTLRVTGNKAENVTIKAVIVKTVSGSETEVASASFIVSTSSYNKTIKGKTVGDQIKLAEVVNANDLTGYKFKGYGSYPITVNDTYITCDGKANKMPANFIVIDPNGKETTIRAYINAVDNGVEDKFVFSQTYNESTVYSPGGGANFGLWYKEKSLNSNSEFTINVQFTSKLSPGSYEFVYNEGPTFPSAIRILNFPSLGQAYQDGDIDMSIIGTITRYKDGEKVSEVSDVIRTVLKPQIM
ncbi:MAG: Ig-like domain-containing protein [Clostridia bacterium]|nr:Ig-like domain-containing protein [Clostridia bacterium]